jgi:hypothetical protein
MALPSSNHNMITHDSLLLFLKEKENFTMFSDNEFLKMIFSNYKPSSKKGWLLSSYGCTLLSKYIQSYPIKLPNQIDNKTIITLSKIIQSPYHIDNKLNKITVFDLDIHTTILLFGIDGLASQL